MDKKEKSEELSQIEAQLILHKEKLRERALRDAHRVHTQLLFGLWLLLVIGLSSVAFVILQEGMSDRPIPLFVVLLFLTLVTGAYAYQEAARIHKRIDAILKLMEKN